MKYLKLLALALILSNPCLANPKIASIDLGKIYSSYSVVKEAQQKISTLESEFKNFVSEAEAKLNDLEKSEPKNLTLMDKEKEELQSQIDEKAEILEDEKESYNLKINRSISKTLETYAKSKSLDLILDKRALLIPVEDITDDFLIKLENYAKNETERNSKSNKS